MKKFLLAVIILLAPLVAIGEGSLKKLPYDFAKNTPQGSWQVKEVTTTDHKGKTTLGRIKTSVVGLDKRAGETFYWIEIETTQFKLKKGKRVQDGKKTIMKALVPASAFEGDVANVVNNLRGIAEDLILQTGDADPIRLSGAGVMAQALLGSLDLEVEYGFEPQATEEIEVPAGNFSCQKVSGKGSATAKVLIKRITVESESTLWVSTKMPFGVVRSITDDVVNGKAQHAESVVVEYGLSGAESQITKEPTSMPGFGG